MNNSHGFDGMFPEMDHLTPVISTVEPGRGLQRKTGETRKRTRRRKLV